MGEPSKATSLLVVWFERNPFPLLASDSASGPPSLFRMDPAEVAQIAQMGLDLFVVVPLDDN